MYLFCYELYSVGHQLIPATFIDSIEGLNQNVHLQNNTNFWWLEIIKILSTQWFIISSQFSLCYVVNLSARNFNKIK